MTLIVSLRIPDGVVIAADSLASVQQQIQISGDVGVVCPECGKQHEIKGIKLPAINIPTSTKSNAQKLLAFQEHFGIGTYGNQFVNKKSIYSHLKGLQRSFAEKGKEKVFHSVDDLAEEIRNYFDKELRIDVPNIDETPDTFYPVGFQVAGFDKEGVGTTCVVKIGKNSNVEQYKDQGVTYSGDIGLVQKLLKKGDDPHVEALAAGFASFSLQDAVDFAEFLIGTTASYQRFANMIPRVGGDIDIALVTNYSSLKWIKRKQIAEILEGS